MNYLKNVLAFLLVLTSFHLSGQDYILEKLDPQINSTEYDEIAPRISTDGQQLFFTRVGSPVFEKTFYESSKDLSHTLSESEFFSHLQKTFSTIAGKPIIDPVSSSFNQDIWIAHFSDNIFTTIEHPGHPLNNALPNSVSSFGTNENEVIVINQFVEGGGMKKGFSRLFKKEDGTWTFPEGLTINNYHNSGADVNLTMSQDGNVIILAMERPDAIGRSDLYISHRRGNQWSMPTNMGPGVNSPWREGTPHLSADGKTLYFSSDRGYQFRGGTDIFMQERLGPGWEQWSAPKRFRKPINSKAHDSHPYFCIATGHLYFNSTRDGSSDIYRIQIKEPQPPINPITIVKRAANQPPEIQAMVQLPSTTSPSIPTPKYRHSVPKKIKVSELVHSSTNELPIVIGTQLEIDHIFFKQSTADVLHQSYPTLDQLSRLLIRHPGIQIRITGHTDNRGKEADLIQLSKKRASAIRQFLVVKKNIDPRRIKILGLGGHLPITENVTETGRRKNRRVEIEIIEIDETSLGMGRIGN